MGYILKNDHPEYNSLLEGGGQIVKSSATKNFIRSFITKAFSWAIINESNSTIYFFPSNKSEIKTL